MVIELSKRRIRRLAVAASLPFLLASLALLGRSVTPRDAMNEPLLLSPGLKSTLEYRAQARIWAKELRTLDQELAALLTGDDDIYRQAQAVNDLTERAVRLAQEVDIRQVPAALAGLRTLLSGTGLAYLGVTQAAAEWVGAPTPDREQAVLDALEAASSALVQVEQSRWLDAFDMQYRDSNEGLSPPFDDRENSWWTTPTP